jgi:hypothetical protein
MTAEELMTVANLFAVLPRMVRRCAVTRPKSASLQTTIGGSELCGQATQPRRRGEA